MKAMNVLIMFAAVLMASAAMAQSQAGGNQSADEPANNMQVLQQKMQADRKFLVASNMDLTQAEADKFWPIYDRYVGQLQKVNARMLRVIKTYAADYNAGTLTDQKAGTLLQEAFSVEEAGLKLRKSYAADLGKVLPEKKVARAGQIENKLRAVVMYELAENIPLAE